MGPREQKIMNAPWTMALTPSEQISDVVLSYQIETDSGRVLYALSIPEYIEAWLRPPETDDVRFAFSPEGREAFRIDLFRGGLPLSSVRSSCRIVSSNQVRYTWKMTSPIDTTDTRVDIHLRCSPGGCILGLKHSGFRTSEESAWYYKMWHQSLENLCRIVSKNRTSTAH
jgi:uncharacterized protein YndB with AHSA1/START domain